MKHIELFENFLLEARGYLSTLEPIADTIIQNLQNSNQYTLKINYLNQDIIIQCHFEKPEHKVRNLAAGVRCISNEPPYTFELYTSELRKDYILHELKHIDFMIRKNRLITLIIYSHNLIKLL
jgi:hypothetical protein